MKDNLNMPDEPQYLEVLPENIPESLRQMPRWLIWRAVPQGNKTLKMPYQASRTNARASSTDDSTWATFHEAIKSYREHGFDGIGFALGSGCGVTMIDLDDVHDRNTGEITADAENILDTMNTYAELSPSGTGLHIVAFGKPPGDRKRGNGIEMYAKGQYLTFTGQRIGEHTTVEERQEQIEQIYTVHLQRDDPRSTSPARSARPTGASDEEVLHRARSGKHATKFTLLWDGRWETVVDEQGEQRYDSQSEADLALAGMLWFESGDPQQVDRLFRQSKLMRDKWDERRHGDGSTYGQGTIRRVRTGRVRGRVLPSTEPMRLAAAYLNAEHRDEAGRILLRRYRGDFYSYTGTHYTRVNDEQLDNTIYPFLDNTYYVHAASKKSELKKVVANDKNANATRSALGPVGAFVDDRLELPAWLDGASGPDPKEIVITRSGALHLPTGEITPATPHLFTLNALDFAYDPEADCPEWLAFLQSVLPDDDIHMLQQWVGYILTADTSQHKALLLIGPTRSGKGTILDIMTALVGEANSVGTTLQMLASNFGASALIGTLLATVGDMRGHRHRDYSQAVGRILSITGEDRVLIDVKNRDPWSGKPSTRFAIATNEPPVALQDHTGALANRFVILEFTKSFLGREDNTLKNRLRAELPGILNWAIEGWHSLRIAGRFTESAGSHAAKKDLEIATSPILAFVSECCLMSPELEITCAELFARWKIWAEYNNLPKSEVSREQDFGKKLRAAFPGQLTATKKGHNKVTVYQGIQLDPTPKHEVIHEEQPADVESRDDGLPF